MHKNSIKRLIKKADITKDEWHCPIVEKIGDDFSRGYVSAKLESLNGIMRFSSEDFREEFLEAVEEAL